MIGWAFLLGVIGFLVVAFLRYQRKRREMWLTLAADLDGRITKRGGLIILSGKFQGLDLIIEEHWTSSRRGKGQDLCTDILISGGGIPNFYTGWLLGTLGQERLRSSVERSFCEMVLGQGRLGFSFRGTTSEEEIRNSVKSLADFAAHEK